MNTPDAEPSEPDTFDDRLRSIGSPSNISALRDSLNSSGYAGDFYTDDATIVVYATDNSIYQIKPAAIAVPSCRSDIAILAQCNNELEVPFPLAARGGGTGTNGQSLTNGIVVDTKRACRRIISIDPEAREATVEPGVVLDELNHELSIHGLFFAPHVSTSSRATIGGMVATDAARKGSMVHGRTNRHVVGINAVLADGAEAHFTTPTLLNSKRTETADSARVSTLRRTLDETLAGVDVRAFPAIERGFTGYNLVDAVAGNSVDITKLLCGSEGTLALVTSIRIKLTPVPSETHLVVLGFDNFLEAIDASIRLSRTKPSAIECLDERTIALAKSSPAWPTLQSLFDRGTTVPNALLLLEFDNSRSPNELELVLQDSGPSVVQTTDPNVIKDIWKIRKDAVGLLGRQVDGFRAIPFVEDCAVPTNRMAEFVRDFRHVLDSHSLSYGMFGHADVGCIHVRPALDLNREEHRLLIRTISDEVADLVHGYGGVLWGEHGKGFRGEFSDLPADLHRRMRQVKTAFDPKNILNPHKLYTPTSVDQTSNETIVSVDQVPLRVDTDRLASQEKRNEFESAFACNGNGICHHWGDAEVMCPSYKVTRDPGLSPKGRADLFRAWAADPNDDRLVDGLKESLEACLSCSACTGRCPVSVDIPELKSRFLHHNGVRPFNRRVRDRTVGSFEKALPALRRLGPFGSVLNRLSQPAIDRSFGLVDLPQLAPFDREQFARLGVPFLNGTRVPADVTVIVVPDAFTLFFEPSILLDTAVVLLSVGERPAVGPFVPSGKYYHLQGQRDLFRRAVAAQRRMVEGLVNSGTELVMIEPATQLLYSNEYQKSDPTFPADAVRSLPEYLVSKVDSDVSPTANPDQENVTFFGHCAESSLAPGNNELYRQLFSAFGLQTNLITTTCCGMAGMFGHEKSNQQLSRNLFDQFWKPQIERSRGQLCAPGYSCRSQARRFGAGQLVHPIQTLASRMSQ